MIITSAKNPLLQEVRRAAQTGRPTEEGCVVLEGPNLLEGAAGSDWAVTQVIGTAAARDRWPHLIRGTRAPFQEVEERALHSIAGTETMQGVIALAKPKIFPMEAMLGGDPLIVVLDGLQDPGNVGTLVRSAEAFGATGVVACKGGVRLANGKFLRATAGSIFRMPYFDQTEPEELHAKLMDAKVAVYALTAHARTHLSRVDLKKPCALVIGNEGGGVSEIWRSRATPVSIPVVKVESLNAAVAGSIALFEAARQRSFG